MTVQQLIDYIHQYWADYDTSWLEGYLNSLPASQRGDAISAVQGQIQSSSVSSEHDLDVAAHHAVDQQSGGSDAYWKNQAIAQPKSRIPQSVQSYFKQENIPQDQQQQILQAISADQYGDPLQIARAVHWQNMSPLQRAQYPQPGDATDLSFLHFAPGENSDYSGLQKYLNSLPADVKHAVLQQLRDQAGQLAQQNDLGMLTSHDLITLTNSARQQGQQFQQQAQKQGSTPNLTQSLEAQGVKPSQTGANAPTQPQSTASSPTDPYNLQALTPEDWNGLSTALGYNAQQHYIDQVNAFQVAQQAAHRRAALGRYIGNEVATSLPPAPHATGLDPVQWGQQVQQSAAGQWWPLIQQFNTMYEQDYGQQMPAALKTQLVDAINKQGDPQWRQLALSEAQKAAQGDSAAQTALGELYSTSFLNTTIQAYVAKNPAPGTIAANQAKIDQTQTNSIMSQYRSIFGKDVDPATLAKLKSMDVDQFNQWLNSQPYHGTTYGAYQNTLSQYKSQWLKAFGTEPNDAQIRAMAGKNQQEVQSYIDNSPSRVSGVNIGQYQSYVAAGDDLSKQMFGRPLDDHLIGLMHQALTK